MLYSGSSQCVVTESVQSYKNLSLGFIANIMYGGGLVVAWLGAGDGLVVAFGMGSMVSFGGFLVVAFGHGGLRPRLQTLTQIDSFLSFHILSILV